MYSSYLDFNRLLIFYFFKCLNSEERLANGFECISCSVGKLSSVVLGARALVPRIRSVDLNYFDCWTCHIPPVVFSFCYILSNSHNNLIFLVFLQVCRVQPLSVSIACKEINANEMKSVKHAYSWIDNFLSSEQCLSYCLRFLTFTELKSMPLLQFCGKFGVSRFKEISNLFRKRNSFKTLKKIQGNLRM